MKPSEANEILRSRMEDFIVKRNAQANHDKIMAMVENYISECSSNSHYDQVANINTLVRCYDKGDFKAFLSAIQYKDTLTHISSDKDMLRK